jgi:serine/threonine protein kinase
MRHSTILRETHLNAREKGKVFPASQLQSATDCTLYALAFFTQEIHLPSRDSLNPTRHQIQKMGVRLIKPEELDLKETLGHGGYGTVRLATFRSKAVAVKELLKAVFTVDVGEDEVDPEVFKSFWMEVSTMQKLGHHDNLVDLIGVSPVGVQQRLVLELCELGSLWDALFKSVRSSSLIGDYKSRLLIARDVACGMAHLHKCKVQHRDLKPENILLSRSNNRVVAKIADFGLAKLRLQQNRKTTADVLRGSVTYVAPELLRQMVTEGMGNYTYTNASDVYSYGILLIELFSGQQHLAGLNDLQKSRMVLADGYRVVVPTLDGTVKSVIEKCVDVDQANRFSFEQIVVALDDLICGKVKENFAVQTQRVTSLITSPSQSSIEQPAATADIPKVKKIHPKVKVTHTWKPGPEHKDNFLGIFAGEVLDVVQRDENKGWTWGISSRGAGWFPNSFCTVMTPSEQLEWTLKEGKSDEDVLATMTKLGMKDVHMVARYARAKLLSTLVDEVDVVDGDGKSCLHHVAALPVSEAATACATVLFDKNANVNLRDKKGFTPVMYAVRNVPVLKILMARVDRAIVSEAMDLGMQVLNEDPRSDVVAVLQRMRLTEA